MRARAVGRPASLRSHPEPSARGFGPDGRRRASRAVLGRKKGERIGATWRNGVCVNARRDVASLGSTASERELMRIDEPVAFPADREQPRAGARALAGRFPPRTAPLAAPAHEPELALTCLALHVVPGDPSALVVHAISNISTSLDCATFRNRQPCRPVTSARTAFPSKPRAKRASFRPARSPEPKARGASGASRPANAF